VDQTPESHNIGDKNSGSKVFWIRIQGDQNPGIHNIVDQNPGIHNIVDQNLGIHNIVD